MKNITWIVLSILLLDIGCTTPHTPSPTPHSPEEAIQTLRELAGLPGLPVQFVGMTSMANSPDGNLQVGSYKDSQGRLYSVDLAINQVVEVDGRPAMPNSLTKTPVLSEPELKAKAEKLARATTPNYDAVIKALTYTTGTKGDLYFFDWRGTMAPGASMPRFIQVALHVDGEVVAYINTVIVP